MENFTINSSFPIEIQKCFSVLITSWHIYKLYFGTHRRLLSNSWKRDLSDLEHSLSGAKTASDWVLIKLNARCFYFILFISFYFMFFFFNILCWKGIILSEKNSHVKRPSIQSIITLIPVETNLTWYFDIPVITIFIYSLKHSSTRQLGKSRLQQLFV